MTDGELRSGLYLVSTPIGNLRDITYRAVDTLKGVELILCEDSRIFARLAQAYAIDTPRKSLHEHNERSGSQFYIERLRQGARLALVSDAGTPTISDPGFVLVRACRREGIPVWSVPGPSAVTAALSVSGVEPDQFLFTGFLPPKSGKKKNTLLALIELNKTIIFYESPHKIRGTLELLAEVAPDLKVTVVRELTKIYEEVLAGLPSEVLIQLTAEKTRGEFVVILSRKEFVENYREHETEED